MLGGECRSLGGRLLEIGSLEEREDALASSDSLFSKRDLRDPLIMFRYC